MPCLVPSIFAFAIVQLVAGYTCPNTPISVKYQGQPYAFPAKGTDDHYDSNQNCSWIVQVPDGFYINYGYNADGRDAYLETSELRGTLATNNVYEEYELDVVDIKMCDQLTINLLSFDNAKGTFRFNIMWIKKVAPAEPMVIQVADFGNNVFDMQNMLGQNTVTFNSSNKIYLSIDSQNYEQENEVIIYDGPDVVSGADYWTLEDANGLTFVDDGVKSTKSSLTLYSPKIDANLREYAIVNDLRNIAQYKRYGAAVVTDSVRTAELSSDHGKTSAFTFTSRSGTLILNDIRHDLGADPVKAIEGFPSVEPPVLLGVFTEQTKLPYNFNTTTVTFIISATSYTDTQLTVGSTQTASSHEDLPVIQAKPIRRMNRTRKTSGSINKI